MLVGFIFSILSSQLLAKILFSSTAVLSIAGLLVLMGSPLSLRRLLSPETLEFRISNLIALSKVIGIQILFLILSFGYFYLMERQTEINSRIQPLEMGRLLLLLKSHPLILGFFPWILYTVMGVGLAYLSICLKRPPTIAKSIIPNFKQHPQLFFHNFFEEIVSLTIFGTVFFSLSLALLWLCEALNVSFEWPSLFKYPLKTIFIISFLMLILRKPCVTLIEKFLQRKMPLANILIILVLIFTLFVFWLHSFGTWFILGLENINPETIVKSKLAGHFTFEREETRLSLLVWGWWGLFIPIWTSIIARLSIGRRVIQACVNSLVLPSVLFLILLPMANTEQIKALFSTLTTFQYWIIALSIFLFVMIIWGHVQNTADLSRGIMPNQPGLRARPIKKAIRTFLLALACYLLALFLIGWLPGQILCTFSGLFMQFAAVGIIGSLILTIAPSWAVTRYKPQELL